jgi:hypothetical protein
MAFCNSCGATLSEGTKFCSKCGAAISGNPSGMSTTPPVQAPMPAPPPSKGSSSALKIVLMIVGGIVLIGILGMVTCGIVIHRMVKNAKVTQNGDKVKIESPFGSVDTDPEQTVKDLGVDIYPGAQVQKSGTASVSFGPIRTVTGIFESSDSVDKICDFYRSKFPNATVNSSDQDQCSIISGGPGNSTTVTVQSSGDGSKITIAKVTKK